MQGEVEIIKTDNSPFERVGCFKDEGIKCTGSILFRKKLRVDCSQEMLAIIRCRIFCLQVAIQKYKN
jgi:hypothetical protein